MALDTASAGPSAETIVAIVAGAAVSIGVALLAFRSGVLDRRQQARMAREEREHQAKMARQEQQHQRALAEENRNQERLKSVYATLLPTLHTIGAQVELVERAIQTDPPEVPPKLPSTEEVLRQVALSQLLGSGPVRADVPLLLLALRRLNVSIGSLELLGTFAGPFAPPNLSADINRTRESVFAEKQTIFDLITKIEAQMRVDLGVEGPRAADSAPPEGGE